MPTPLEFLCSRVRGLCTLTGISYNDLENDVGIGLNTITNWSKAKSLPSADKILGVANRFGVSVDYLLGNTDNPKSHKNAEVLASEFIKSLKNLTSATQEVENFVQGYLLYPNESETKGDKK